MKRRIQLTEQDIVRMVKRAVNEVKLNEMDWRTYKNAEKESNKREREYDKKISRLRDKSNRDINYEKNQDKYEKQIDDLKKKREKEFKRGYKFHDYSDELMNKKHNFDRKSKYGTMRQYASSNSGGITLNKIFKGNNGIQTIEREFKHILPSKKAKNSIEHRQFGNTFKYDYDNPPAPFSDKSDKSADLFGDSSNLEKEIIGYNTGRDQYEPGKGWPEYNESFNRRVKKSIRESLRRMNESEDDIVYVNDEEDGRTVRVYSIPSNDYYGYPIKFGVYNDQDDIQSDLELIVAFAEKNGYKSIFADEDAEEAYQDNLKETGNEEKAENDLDDWYMYIDATMDGAKGTHFIYNNIHLN